jgi:GntR family transcriptional regulator
LRVNFNTIARAYRILDEVGLISTQQGRGTYILEETPPEMSRNIKEQSLQEMARTFIHETKQLGFSLDEILQVLKNSSGEIKKIDDLTN